MYIVEISNMKKGGHLGQLPTPKS